MKWTSEYEKQKGGDAASEAQEGGRSSSSRRFEFVPTVWLVNWLAEPESVGPLETRHLLCVHGRLDIDRICDFKICDAATVDRLVREHGKGEGPRLDQVKYQGGWMWLKRRGQQQQSRVRVPVRNVKMTP